MKHDLAINIADLAPGDHFAAKFDWSRFKPHLIASPRDELFEPAYQRMWDEFSGHDSMESRDVIESRLAWDPAAPIGGWRFLYRIMAILEGSHLAAMRDATVIVSPNAAREAIVHLSHVLVEPKYRGGHLAAWLRAFPLQMARATGGDDVAITLVAEMERQQAGDLMSIKRLSSYERAGFLKLDPVAVDYHQPDFRPPAKIDESGGARPLPYQLIVRRVGREKEDSLSGGEVRRMVSALYQAYGQHFRPADMAIVWKSLDNYPAEDSRIRLLPPSG